jgi:hypothetical protein
MANLLMCSFHEGVPATATYINTPVELCAASCVNISTQLAEMTCSQLFFVQIVTG